MQIATASYAGWQNNLRLHNPDAELIVSLDIGPRILSYRLPNRENVLKNYPDQMGQAREDAFMIRGGHRLWLAPEDEKLTYHWDNEPVTHTIDAAGMVVIESAQREPWQIRKELGVRLDERGSRVRVLHRATNTGSEPIECATWGLTVMEPGGLQIIPQPPMGEHPRDLLPNRGLVLWPYTDLSDERLQFGRNYWYLRQVAGSPPIKLGIVHTAGWVAYSVHDCLFLKRIEHLADARYPDGGCNYETFTNSEMIEIESLGPLCSLAPGESASHSEEWYLFDAALPEFEDEAALGEWLGPFLDAAGLQP